MAFFAVPRLKKILDDRKSHIDRLLSVAREFSEKSEKIERKAERLLDKTKQDIFEAEEKLINELERENLEEKKRLSEEILENTNEQIASLKSSSQEVFKSVSSDLDEFVSLALQKIESRNNGNR